MGRFTPPQLIMTWDSITLFEQSDIETDRLRSMGFLLQAKEASLIAELYEARYNEVKDYFKLKLISYFNTKYSQTPSQLYEEAMSTYRGSSKTYNIIYSLGDGVWYDTFVPSLKSPLVYYNAGVPDSTVATTALNGDYLVNTNRNGFLYINRSETSTPDWQRFLSSSLVDYILDETVLKLPAIAYFIHKAMLYLAVPQTAGSEAAMELYMIQANNWKTIFNEHWNLMLGALIVDVSGDGIASNAEVEAIDEQEGWVVAG